MALRVAVLVECPIQAEGFRSVVSAQCGIELVSVSLSFDEFIAAAGEQQAEILLVDVSSGLSIAQLREILERFPKAKTILWVHSVPVSYVYAARQAGVRGILRKSTSVELTLRCIQKVGEGETWFDRELLDTLIDYRVVRLSPREQQLVELISHGLRNKQIAGELGISEGTVKVYLSKLFRKVGVSDRFELALYGLDNKNMAFGEAGRSKVPRKRVEREDHAARRAAGSGRR